MWGYGVRQGWWCGITRSGDCSLRERDSEYSKQLLRSLARCLCRVLVCVGGMGRQAAAGRRVGPGRSVGRSEGARSVPSRPAATRGRWTRGERYLPTATNEVGDAETMVCSDRCWAGCWAGAACSGCGSESVCDSLV